jgi:hypothetical protein
MCNYFIIIFDLISPQCCVPLNFLGRFFRADLRIVRRLLDEQMRGFSGDFLLLTKRVFRLFVVLQKAYGF